MPTAVAFQEGPANSQRVTLCAERPRFKCHANISIQALVLRDILPEEFEFQVMTRQYLPEHGAEYLSSAEYHDLICRAGSNPSAVNGEIVREAFHWLLRATQNSAFSLG